MERPSSLVALLLLFIDHPYGVFPIGHGLVEWRDIRKRVCLSLYMVFPDVGEKEFLFKDHCHVILTTNR
jgi:hypothetical protein